LIRRACFQRKALTMKLVSELEQPSIVNLPVELADGSVGFKCRMCLQ